MKFKMAQNSLFAILLRSQWWVSFAVAAGIFAGLRLVLPGLYAAFFALPFVAIGGYAAWRALRAPSAATVAKGLEAIGAMPWEDFRNAVEAAYRRDGYAVSRLAGEDADLELVKAGRTSLLACKRWRVARTGIEPLRQLHAARRKRDAQDCIYLCVGEITDNARSFATENKVHMVSGAALVQLLNSRRRPNQTSA
jgi:restriction system protein